MKKCKKCNIIKDLFEFGINKNKSDGRSIYCKECERLRGVDYRNKHRDKVNQSSKNYRKNNPEKYKESINKYLEKHPEMLSKNRLILYRKNEEFKKKEKIKRKEWYLKNIDSIREKSKKYYHENKKVLREKNNVYKSLKLKIDPLERLEKNLRDRIREYLTGENKSKRTFEIIGLDKEKFKSYIESKFKEGMSWENYGEWHLDHIKPLYLSENEEDLVKLNHYTNLQPLWAEDNIKKNIKYDN